MAACPGYEKQPLGRRRAESHAGPFNSFWNVCYDFVCDAILTVKAGSPKNFDNPCG
jgi:hypothetical protein